MKTVTVGGMVPSNTEIYRFRITVLDTRGAPVKNARVFSSIGDEATKVDGGWEIDVPGANLPPDAKLIV